MMGWTVQSTGPSHRTAWQPSFTAVTMANRGCKLMRSAATFRSNKQICTGSISGISTLLMWESSPNQAQARLLRKAKRAALTTAWARRKSGSPAAKQQGGHGAEMQPAGRVAPEVPIIRQLDASELPHLSVEQWVVFSDLHVGVTTLDVCLQVLRRVRAEAEGRPACGVVFLGDFWHVRGVLRVDLLNPVLAELATWRVPVIMIPGNHDQVTLAGQLHALTPLQFAFEDPSQVLVFSEPTWFLNALWVPHCRDHATVEVLMQTPQATQASAIFCHVDVRGAAMNDNIISQSGIRPSAFPPGVPVYTGHYHKPHRVGSSLVTYVGSPYQTSLSESGQAKALVVLGSRDWRQRGLIPLELGKKYFRVRGEGQPLPQPQEMTPGDRVVWSVEEPSAPAVLERVRALRDAQVEVELRQLPKPGTGLWAEDHSARGNITGSANSGAPTSEACTPATLLSQFFSLDSTRNLTQDVREAGHRLLEGLLSAGAANSSSTTSAAAATGVLAPQCRLVVQEVALKNFGPFKDPVTYPLHNRGLVLLRGLNLDDTGSDSNGAGKSTLAAATLWALTGQMDPRPLADGRVVDVVHDSFGPNGKRLPAVAEVTLTGTLNGKPLVLSRRKGARVNQLALQLDGEDLTCQGARETQAVLEDQLGLCPGIVGRAIFQGQHHMYGLLESTNAGLRDELSSVVSVEVWHQAAALCRATAKEQEASHALLQAQVAWRRKDLDKDRKAVSDAALVLSDHRRGTSAEGPRPNTPPNEEQLQALVDAAQAAHEAAAAALEEAAEAVLHGIERLSALRAATYVRTGQEMRDLQDLVYQKEREVIEWQKRVDTAEDWVLRSSAKVENTGARVEEQRLAAPDAEALLSPSGQPLNGVVERLQQAVSAAKTAHRDAETSLAIAQARILQLEEERQEHSVLMAQGKGVCRSCGQTVSSRHLQRKEKEMNAELTEARHRAQNAETHVKETEESLGAATRQLGGCLSVCEAMTEHTQAQKELRAAQEEQRESKAGIQRAKTEFKRAEEDLHDAQVAQEHLEQGAKERERAGEVEVERLKEVQHQRGAEKLEAYNKLRALQGEQSKANIQRVRLSKWEVIDSHLSTVLRQQEAEVKRTESQLQELEAGAQAALESRALHAALAEQFGPRGIQSYVLRGAVEQLEGNVGVFLDSLSDGALRLSLMLVEADRVQKKVSIRDHNGVYRERALSQLSGGQWRRVSLALELAFAALARQRGRFSCNLLVLDEVLSQLDTYGRTRVASVLKALAHGDEAQGGPPQAPYSTVLVVLQDLPADDLQEVFDHIDEVMKAGDKSTVVIDLS